MEIQALAELGSRTILAGFETYHNKFKEITRRAARRFARRDWHGMQHDAVERLDLYAEIIQTVVKNVKNTLDGQYLDKSVWAEMKRCYSRLIQPRGDLELAETFFNSVTRRIFTTIGVDPVIEYVDSDFDALKEGAEDPICRGYERKGSTRNLLAEVLEDYPFEAPFDDLERDLTLAAQEIDAEWAQKGNSGPIQRVEFVNPVFYRSKGAFLIGRIPMGEAYLPLVLALWHHENGIFIDAVLMDGDDVSILFSFTRSYFHTDVEKPHELIQFLHKVMPWKRIAELYISVGYNKHGKSELYRDLLHHLERSNDRFQIAPGEKGMVMLVFTLPSYDVVFKVIRDHFGEPKTTTRQEVKDRYQLVFKHDRAGRLVDAQEFEHLTFSRQRFSEDLVKELQQFAAESVIVDAEFVSIKHLYTERRMTPMDLYVRSAPFESAREAVIEYGQSIKDLAATNIFPGDILLKNFGVTRHGRVVFYDYDELGLLADYNFRQFPQAREYSDDFEAEPWFFVGKNDIFPEEFSTFLGLSGPLREVFVQHHSDLFTARFWRTMQERLQAGEIIDTIPYKQSIRLHRDHRFQ